MPRQSIPLIISAACLAISPVIASAQDADSSIEPLASDIAMSAANHLASQDKLSFNWFVSYDEIVDEQEKITFFRSGNMVLDRGNGFVARTERGNTYRDFYFDGSVFSIVSPNENFYASIEIEGGIDALEKGLRERSDTILPLWSILSQNLPDRILEGVENGAYLGTTLIAGQPAHHIAFSQEDFDWQIWVSMEEETPFPLMIIGTESQRTGWPQYRAYFSDWNLEPDIEGTQFSYEPEDDDVRMTMPALAAAGQSNTTQSE